MADNIAQVWEELKTVREPSLQRVRETARHAAPYLLPADEQIEKSKDSYHNRVYSSLPRLGAMNLPQRITGLIMPPGIPWLQYVLTPAAISDMGTDEAELLSAQRALFQLENVALGMFHSARGVPAGANRKLTEAMIQTGASHRPGADAQVRAMVEQFIVQSDAAVQLRPDYTLRVYRRDAYVTERDAGMSMVRVITRERLRRESLTDEQMRMADLDDDDFPEIEQNYGTAPYTEKTDLFTEVRYDPRSPTDRTPWTFRQQVNKHIIYEKRTPMPDIWTISHNIPTDGHYGIGVFEALLPSIQTMDDLERALVNMMSQAANNRPVLDAASQLRAADFSDDKFGRVIEGGVVREGRVMDVGLLPTVAVPQYNMLTDGIERARRQLSRALMIETEATRQAERVTAVEIQRDAELVQESLGGVLTTLADQFLVPLARQLRHRVIADGLVEDGDSLELISDPHITSGLTAIQRLREAEEILQVAQIVGGIGAIEHLNVGNMIEIYMRKRGMNEPGLIRSDEELAAMREQQAQAEATQQAAGQMAGAAGAQLLGGQ